MHSKNSFSVRTKDMSCSSSWSPRACRISATISAMSFSNSAELSPGCRFVTALHPPGSSRTITTSILSVSSSLILRILYRNPAGNSVSFAQSEIQKRCGKNLRKSNETMLSGLSCVGLCFRWGTLAYLCLSVFICGCNRFIESRKAATPCARGRAAERAHR